MDWWGGWVRLSDRRGVLVAVDRAGRGEHELVHVPGVHRAEQIRGTGQVGVEVLQRYLHRFPYGLLGREMDHHLNRILGEHLVEGLVVPQIQLIGGDRAASQPGHASSAAGELFE